MQPVSRDGAEAEWDALNSPTGWDVSPTMHWTGGGAAGYRTTERVPAAHAAAHVIINDPKARKRVAQSLTSNARIASIAR